MPREKPMRSSQRVIQRYTQHVKPGRLDWIGVRPERLKPMREMPTTTAIEGLGLEGDRRCQGSLGSGRQVTLISAEHIKVIESLMGFAIPPDILRRNLVISGINITALKYRQFQIGDAVLEATVACHPCGRMEKALGQGGFAAMIGHGGLCAKIVKGGVIAVGSSVSIIETDEDKQAVLF